MVMELLLYTQLLYILCLYQYLPEYPQNSYDHLCQINCNVSPNRHSLIKTFLINFKINLEVFS